MKAIVDAITNGTTEYAVGDLSIPGLRHFLYKSRPHVQITAPVFEEPYADLDERMEMFANSTRYGIPRLVNLISAGIFEIL